MRASGPSVPNLRLGLLPLAAASLFSLPAGYAAPGDPFGPPVQVNTTTAGRPEDPDVAQNPAGNRVVVWDDFRHVYAQRIGNGGALVGPEIRVDSLVDGNVTRGRVAINASGRFAVVWGALGEAYGRVYLRRYDSDGSPLGAEALVGTGATYSEASVALDDDGDAAVAWAKDDAGGRHAVYVSRYDADGVAKGTAAKVSPFTGGHHNLPSVACEPDGDFTVAWTSYGSAGHVLGAGYLVIGGAGGTGSRAWFRRYHANGTPVDRARVVASALTGGVGLPPSEFLDSGRFIAPLDLDLAMDIDGDYAISWVENGYGFSSSRMRVRRYDAAGQEQSHAVVAEIAPRQGAMLYPTVSINDAGDLVAAWQGSANGAVVTPDNEGLFYRRYDAAGAPRGPFRKVPSGGGSPETTMAADGNFAMYWEGPGISGQEFEGP